MNAILYGVVGGFASPWQYLFVGLASVMGTIFSVTLYLHRSQAHRSVTFHPVVAHLMRFWLWLTTGMKTKEWVAIHRKHHVYTDRDGDPHTPVGKRWWQVLFLVREYMRETRNQQTLERYGRGTPHDWIERNLYARHPALGVTLGALTAMTLFGVFPGGLIAFAHAFWIPFWAAFVINGLGHLFGYRNYDTPDKSHNTAPFFCFALWIGGEELHNNHHAYPTSAKFSARWFEFDIGWGVIIILSWLGLATVKHRMPRVRFDPSRKYCDMETLRAIQALRYDVLRRFDGVIRRIGKDVPRERISQAKAHFEKKRHQLKVLWENPKLTSGQLLGLLGGWRDRALKSEYSDLRDFARRLAWYRLQDE